MVLDLYAQLEAVILEKLDGSDFRVLRFSFVHPNTQLLMIFRKSCTITLERYLRIGSIISPKFQANFGLLL